MGIGIVLLLVIGAGIVYCKRTGAIGGDVTKKDEESVPIWMRELEDYEAEEHEEAKEDASVRNVHN